MLYSNARKLSLSGWLQKNNAALYSSPLKLQKFLFFYEAFSKVDGEQADFQKLKGYKRGSVFSSVWGDYTKDREEFDAKALESYNSGNSEINKRRAERANFVVSVLSERELSDLTHEFEIWKSKESQIMSGQAQVELHEADFSDDDYAMTKVLEEMYPDEMIRDSKIVSVGDTFFVFSKEDAKRLTEQHLDTLSALAETADLHNPVFVEIDEMGGLCVD